MSSATACLLAAVVSLAAIPAANALPTPNDCALGQDADIFNPPLMTLPLWCEGEIQNPSGDYADDYYFDISPGDHLRVFAEPKDDYLGTVCVLSPTGQETSEGYCDSFVTSSVPTVYEEANPESGRWLVSVAKSGPPTTGYTLRVTTDRADFQGQLLAGTAGLGVSALAGPGAPPIDGAWHALPAIATGHEGVDLSLDFALPTDVVHVRFFDEALEPVSEDRCLAASSRQSCPAPAGAVWAHVQSHTGALHRYRLAYHYTMPAPPGLYLSTGSVVEGGIVYTTEIPRWVWGPFTAADGIHHYNVYFDDAFVGTREPWDRHYQAPPTTPDGDHCLEVRAVDNVGTEGEAKAHCIFLDRVAPSPAFTSPSAGTIYLFDGSSIQLSDTAAPSLVLGGYWLNLSATDATPASGLKTTQIYEIGETSRTPLSCDPHTADFCSHYEPPSEGVQTDVSPRLLEGESLDNAGNVGNVELSYARVDVGVFRQLPGSANSSGESGLVFWKGAEPSNFLRYEVHRSAEPNFIPCAEDGVVCSKTLVKTVTNAGTTTWKGDGVSTGTHYYKIAYYSGAPGVEVRSISHETLFDYDSTTQEVSDPQPCAAGQPVCI